MISKESSFAEWKVSSHSAEGEKMRAIVPKVGGVIEEKQSSFKR